MRTILLLFAASALSAQLSFVSLYQPAKTSAAVTQGHLLTLNDGCNGCAPGILTVKEISADANLGPVTYGIAMTTVGSGLAVNVCTYGNCTCQFSHSGVALQRGGRVVGDRASSTCQAATDHSNSSIAGISILQDYIGVVAQDGCSDTGLCDVAMAGPWRGGANINPTIDTVPLGAGRAQANFSYANWSTLGGHLFSNIANNGGLYMNGIYPACSTVGDCAVSLIASPGNVNNGNRCVTVTYRATDGLRTTSATQLSMDTTTETTVATVQCVTVSDNTTAGQLSVVVKKSTNGRTSDRCLYMNPVGSSASRDQYLVGCVGNNTTDTTYTVNIDDATLITHDMLPQIDTTGGQVWSAGWSISLCGVSLQSFWDGSCFYGPMAGNGKGFTGYGTNCFGGACGKFLGRVDHATFMGGGGTGNGGLFNGTVPLNTSGHVMFGYGLSTFNAGVSQPDCHLFGKNLWCRKPNDLRIGGGLDPADDGRVLTQQFGVVQAGPLGLSKTVTASCGTMIFTNGILTGGTC